MSKEKTIIRGIISKQKETAASLLDGKEVKSQITFISFDIDFIKNINSIANSIAKEHEESQQTEPFAKRLYNFLVK